MKDKVKSAELSSDIHQEYDLAKLFNLSDPQSVRICLPLKVSVEVKEDESLLYQNTWDSRSCFPGELAKAEVESCHWCLLGFLDSEAFPVSLG